VLGAALTARLVQYREADRCRPLHQAVIPGAAAATAVARPE